MIEGTWHLTGGEQDGQAIPDSVLEKSKLKIVGDVHEVTWGDDFLKGTHTLGMDYSPMRIDSSDTEGPFAGNTLLGIFQLEDDKFTVCFAAPGRERPTAFTTQDGQATLLHVWKRDE